MEKKRLKIIASGRCGLERIYKHLKDDAICFGVFRVYAVEAGIKQPKFVCFMWAGKDTNLKRKGVVNSVKTAVQYYLSVSSSAAAQRDRAARRRRRRRR